MECRIIFSNDVLIYPSKIRNLLEEVKTTNRSNYAFVEGYDVFSPTYNARFDNLILTPFQFYLRKRTAVSNYKLLLKIAIKFCETV